MKYPSEIVKKICSKCKLEKDISEFYKRGDWRRDTHRPDCIKCFSESMAFHRAKRKMKDREEKRMADKKVIVPNEVLPFSRVDK